MFTFDTFVHKHEISLIFWFMKLFWYWILMLNLSKYSIITDLHYEFCGHLMIEIHSKCDSNSRWISLQVNTLMKPIRYVLRMGFRKNVTLCLFCSHVIIKRRQLIMVAKSSIQVVWVPQLSSSKSSLQLFFHWNMSEKGNAQRIKKTTSSHWRRLFCAKSWRH